jgi:hypothetical protein
VTGASKDVQYICVGLSQVLLCSPLFALSCLERWLVVVRYKTTPAPKVAPLVQLHNISAPELGHPFDIEVVWYHVKKDYRDSAPGLPPLNKLVTLSALESKLLNIPRPAELGIGSLHGKTQPVEWESPSQSDFLSGIWVSVPQLVTFFAPFDSEKAK